ncbi:hypothetical protein [Thorsellia anophelis]|uniref:Uncharacterized protein n=1 Tax=Thorsellia anophelis DSM 18579 TaxID=1123402 RepID=A0A1I0EUE8_9GAMM|nr:hypothetical protein [Thorsellia anophelis]SET48223.1 hypothetical protein SAMN02583745_02504 [Thorsellia anophelis DSM 18579]
MDIQSHYNQLWIKTITNPHPEIDMVQTHTIYLPELCPKSQNPAQGSSIAIRYKAQSVLLELFALDKYIKGFIGHQVVRDIEYFVQVVGMECASALGHAVEIEADIHFNQEPPYGLAQKQHIVLTAHPTSPNVSD